MLTSLFLYVSLGMKLKLYSLLNLYLGLLFFSEAQGIKYNWVDITEEFTEAASQLEMGELLHDAK